MITSLLPLGACENLPRNRAVSPAMLLLPPLPAAAACRRRCCRSLRCLCTARRYREGARIRIHCSQAAVEGVARGVTHAGDAGVARCGRGVH